MVEAWELLGYKVVLLTALLRVVIVILEHFECILTVYDITFHYSRKGSGHAFSKLGAAPPAPPSIATASVSVYILVLCSLVEVLAVTRTAPLTH